MRDKVRWGLISTANINRKLIPSIRASPRGELRAVASREMGHAQAYAAKWGIPLAFSGYQEMLDSGQVDAVYISLPNHLHAEWTVKALDAGVHVLCEKPFATRLEEVDRMIAASQESGCILAEAFMYRHHPQTKAAGEWVHSGKLDEITMVRGIFNFSLTQRDNVRLVPEFGGGSLWDIGVYPLSFAQFIYGTAPKSVAGFQWVGESNIDEDFIGILNYPGGGLAEIACSFRSPFHSQVEVIGTRGRLSLNRPFTMMDDNRRMEFHSGQGVASIIPVPEQELYSGEVEDMHSAILDGAPSYITLQETRNHILTALALYQSARQGTVVELKDFHST